MSRTSQILMTFFIYMLLAIPLLSQKNQTKRKSQYSQSVATSYTVPIYYASSASYQPGLEPRNTIDGNTATIWHTPYTGGTLPDTIDFSFVNVARVDSMIYYPRTSGLSGSFGQTEIWYATASEPTTFTKLMDYNYGMSPSKTGIALNGVNGILNPATICVIVKTGYNNFASCAEMVFKTTKPITPPVTPCDPASTLQADVKQTIASATASNFQPGTNGEGPITYSFDGNYSTFYHSNWSGGGFPITLDYTLQNADKVDYLIYYPRNSQSNGLFQQTEIWYSTTSAPSTYIKIMDYDFGGSSSSTKVNFPTSITNPAHFKIIVKSGVNNFASCAEMEFYKSGVPEEATSGIFKDNVCSGLATGVTQANIDNMPNGFFKSLAQCMLNGTYSTKYHLQNYEPYPVVATTAAALKTSYYSQFENPTGIYVDSESTAMVFVENTYGQNISMRVYDYASGADNTYTLSTGANKITFATKGLAYINYYTSNYATLQPVRIHIVGGKINGYYDVTSSTSQDWRNLLSNAVTSMIDLKGLHIGMCYPIAQLKQYSPLDGKELVQLYDSIVRIEHEQMGLYKYNRVPKNHMYAEADNGTWAWNAGGKGAHFSGSCDMTCSATSGKNNIWGLWGIAHELGHVNQIRPGLQWVSTTEVTNNIFSAWVTYLFNNAPYNKKMEVESINDAYYNGIETKTGFGIGNVMVGGRVNAYLNNGILKGQQWMCQYGPDAMKTKESEPDWQNGNGDQFVKLFPLWQLELYYQVVHPEKKDWHGDVAEIVRNTDESGLTNGQLLANFIKNTCDVVQEDLTDFFRKAGMLRTYNRYMNDYESAWLTITAADSAAVVNYIASKGYPKPETPVLYYLTANSVDAFKNKLPVQGITAQGCTPVLSSSNDYQKYVIVDHSVWKNVVVFETYNGQKIVRISMVGSGYTDNSKTRVYYPDGSTSIYAVGWDGSKKLVYGNAVTLEENVNFDGNGQTNLYPNPSDGLITISVPGKDEVASVEIVALNGTIQFKQTLPVQPDRRIHINATGLAAGIYSLRINTSGFHRAVKMVKNLDCNNIESTPKGKSTQIT